MKPEFHQVVYDICRLVPAGKVATYGQIATLVGSPRCARQVGQALAGLRHGGTDEVPWHRIINAKGSISAPNDDHRRRIQQALLEDEGVVFDQHQRCDLRRYRWEPEDSAQLDAVGRAPRDQLD